MLHTQDMQEPLSPQHWGRVLDAVEGGPKRRNRRAEQLWSSAYDAWHAENGPRALELFRRAVLEDPGLADGYLGLYALSDGLDESICQALAVTAERLRECQRRLDKPLTAYYVPLLFEPVALSSPDDARLALVRYLVKTGQPAAAEAWLSRCRSGDSRTMALGARLAFDRRDYEGAVSRLQQIVALDEELRSDAYLLMGICLDALGRHESALSALDASVGCAHHDKVRHYARYRTALVQERLGQEQASRRTLEHIYAQDAGFLDVASRLGVHTEEEAAEEEGDAVWARLCAELESGRVNSDPQIADNR